MVRILASFALATALISGCFGEHGEPSDERANAEPLQLEIDPTYQSPSDPGAVCDRAMRDTVCGRFEHDELAGPVVRDHGGLVTVSIEDGNGLDGWCAMVQVEELPEGTVATACQYPCADPSGDEVECARAGEVILDRDPFDIQGTGHGAADIRFADVRLGVWW